MEWNSLSEFYFRVARRPSILDVKNNALDATDNTGSRVKLIGCVDACGLFFSECKTNKKQPTLGHEHVSKFEQQPPPPLFGVVP